MKIKRPLINPSYEEEDIEYSPKPIQKVPKVKIKKRKPAKTDHLSFNSDDNFFKTASIEQPTFLNNYQPKEKEIVNQISNDQLNFEITPKKPSIKQRFYFLKYYLKKRQEILEISVIWKNPAFPFNLVSLVFISMLIFIGGILEFDRIPAKVPVFYNHLEKTWEQTDKSTIFILGLVILATEGILINLLIKIFNKDRRLALTLSWIITFVNVLILIAILQIYSLIT